MTNKAKPFIKWVGGKTQLIDSIERTLPKDFGSQHNLTYIEPFVGGGAILFWILQKYQNISKAVINDINPDLTTAYKTIKQNPQELIMELRSIQEEYLPLTEENRKVYFLEKRDRFNTKSLDPVENSALFIFLNRTCFNGLYRVNSKGGFNVPFGKYANPKICDEQTILADSELLQKVEILTGDFEETLKFTGEKSFFYFDPPYKPLSETSSFNSYSKENFNDNEQIRLGNFCKQIDILGHNFILSNSDVKGKNPNDEFFDNLYNQFDIKRVFATRMVNANAEKRGKLTELLITNVQTINYIPTNDFIKKSFSAISEIVERVNIDKIKIDKSRFSFNNNISDFVVERIVNSFDLSFWEPIAVDNEYYLRDGQHRLEAAKRMNLDYLDVAILHKSYLAHIEKIN